MNFIIRLALFPWRLKRNFLQHLPSLAEANGERGNLFSNLNTTINMITGTDYLVKT